MIIPKVIRSFRSSSQDFDLVIQKKAAGYFYYPDYRQATGCGLWQTSGAAGLWQTSGAATPRYNPACDQAIWIHHLKVAICMIHVPAEANGAVAL